DIEGMDGERLVLRVQAFPSESYAPHPWEAGASNQLACSTLGDFDILDPREVVIEDPTHPVVGNRRALFDLGIREWAVSFFRLDVAASSTIVHAAQVADCELDFQIGRAHV